MESSGLPSNVRRLRLTIGVLVAETFAVFNAVLIVALVVGINAYHHAPLKNAVNDAKAVAAALESKGVQVFAIYDCNITDLNAIVDEYVNALQKGDAAFVFFSGHAMEYKNTNRLLAVYQSAEPDLNKEALNVLVLSLRLAPCNIVLSFQS